VENYAVDYVVDGGEDRLQIVYATDGEDAMRIVLAAESERVVRICAQEVRPRDWDEDLP